MFPFFYFVPADFSMLEEFAAFTSIVELFRFRGACIGTERDTVCIHWSSEEMQSVIKDFATLGTSELRQQYVIGKDSRDWTVDGARADVRTHNALSKFIRQIFYRPFDRRFTITQKSSRVLGTPSALVKI